MLFFLLTEENNNIVKTHEYSYAQTAISFVLLQLFLIKCHQNEQITW